MRNLKKILAMVLALIMSLSLMATAGATDFSDADQIGEDYEVAVEVLNGLGVFKGYDDGARFEPQGKITRAEVAAIIYRIATGDVTDTQKDIYSSWGMFPDVQDENWFAGYVNYCANAGYIKGRSDGKFWPNQEVTGYEALAMILRAVGYDKLGEFTGSNWQVNTASVARERGILKNISSGQLGQSATREMIAEILFRAILVNKVDYTPAYGYQEGSTSVGYDSLGLEDLSGVVTGNEYADLTSSAPMKDGQTRLNVDGKDYVLDAGSLLTDIGERRHAYVTDKGANVLYHLYDEETDYTVAEPANFGGEGSTVASVLRSKGLRTDENTQYFVNFGEPIDKFTSDVRIEYLIGLNWTEYQIMRLLVDNGGTAKAKDGTVITANDWDAFWARYEKDPSLDVKANYIYDKQIPVEQEITAQDMTFIKEIFYGSDSGKGVFDEAYDIYFGEVYVNTKSQVNNAGESLDISDSISYKKFLEDYINDDFSDFSASDNGEWLKIVDYDNDGIADYVMRTDFVMTTVVDHNTKTDVWFVEYLDYETGLATEIPAAAVSAKTELAMPTESNMKLVAAKDLVEGQVYMYTYIDGVYYITEPVTATDTITSIDYRAESVTGSETRYWSGIDHRVAQYYSEIDEVNKNVEYTLYLDQFGYIRLFTEADKGFVLLIDGYFQTDRRENVFKAQIWDGEKSDIDVTALTGTSFIWNAADREDNALYHDDEGTWKRLKEFGYVYYNPDVASNYGHWVDPRSTMHGTNNYVDDPFLTNIAAYRESDGKYALYLVNDEAVQTSRAHYNAYAIDMTDMTEGDGNGTVYSDTRTLYGITQWTVDDENNVVVDKDSRVRIQTTTETKYYYYDTATGAFSTWNGYNGANAPARFQVAKAYAVSSFVPDRENGNANPLPYQVAEIVVIEGRYTQPGKAADFLYALVDNRTEYLLGATGGDPAYGEKTDATKKSGMGSLILFYDQDGEKITENYRDYQIYAGRVVTYDRVKGRNYVQLSVNKSDLTGRLRATDLSLGNPEHSFYTDEVPLYNVTENTSYVDAGNTLRSYTTRDGSNIKLGDYVIYMLDSSGNMGLVINVTESKNTAGNPVAKLEALWQAISNDQIYYYNTLPFAFYGVSRLNKDQTACATNYGVTYGTAADTRIKSMAGHSNAVFGGYVVVSDTDAVAAGSNHWVAPSATRYEMYRYVSGSFTEGYPGVPGEAQDVYVVYVDRLNTYYILVKEARSANNCTLVSSDHSSAVVGAANAVQILNPGITLGYLQSILSCKDTNGKTITVTVRAQSNATGVYYTNPDAYVASVAGNSDKIWVDFGGNSVQATISSTGLNRVTWSVNGVASVKLGKQVLKSGDMVASASTLTVTVASGWTLTNAGVSGTITSLTDNGDGTFTIVMNSNDIVITPERVTSQSVVDQAKLTVDALTGNVTVVVPNSVYAPTFDADSYHVAIADAVQREVQKALSANSVYGGIRVDVAVTSGQFNTAPGAVNDVYSGTVDVKLTSADGTGATTSTITVKVAVAYASTADLKNALEKFWISQNYNFATGTADDLKKDAMANFPGLYIIDIDREAVTDANYKIIFSCDYADIFHMDDQVILLKLS